MAKVDWDETEYEEGRSGFEALPKGRYSARITDIEKRDTKSKTGYMFCPEFTLDGEQFKNRKVWAQLNVSNPSEIAQRIGREQWNSLIVACGFEIGTVKDTDKLVGKRLIVLVDIEKDQDGSPRNKVTGFFPHDGSAPAPGTSGGTRTGRTSGSAPAASNTPKPAGKAEIDEDDIPF